MKDYKVVIFDLDGTLADTSEGIYNCIRYAQKMMGLPNISAEQMRSHIGPPMQESYARNFNLKGDDLGKAVSFHKEYALTKGLYEAEVYENIPELLQQLKAKGIKTCVATLKFEETARKMLDHLKISSCFDAICGTLSEIKLNKAQLLEKCLVLSQENRADALLIGDSSYDAIGAQEAGIDFLGVAYGFGFTSREDVDKYPNIGCAETVQEIYSLISKN